jgi:hypothetical protein
MKETQEKWRRKRSQAIRKKELRKEENLQNNRKEQGITLIALVVTIVVLLILAGITINLLFSNGGIFKIAGDAVNAWNEATINEQESINNITEQIGNLVNGQIGGESETDQEKIPADGSFNEEKGVNTPDLQDGALTPVKWVEDPASSGTYTMQETTADDPEWYDYSTTAKKWANAITSDGSMWVWVPRYAYQIADNYHTNSATGGTVNIEFLKGTTNEGATGKQIVEYNSSTTSNFTKFPEEYVVHPGFEYSSTAPGLWVAKFEASQSDAGANAADYQNYTGGSSGVIKIQPGVNSWRNISVNDIYTKCLNYAGTTLGKANLNSHMMKNTEWGAVAYLAQSSYGKNAEVWINSNSNYLTGQAGGGPNVTSTTNTSPYNIGNGPQASTTGNVYGVYDMSGGIWKYTAAYVSNNNESLTTYGKSLVNGKNYTKDVYTVGSADDRPTNYIAATDKYGDAVYETSNNYQAGNGSWYQDCSNIPYSTSPFFIYGGYNNDTSTAGLFATNSYSGVAYISYGFRPVLVAL